jgi:hypothetical protein
MSGTQKPIRADRGFSFGRDPRLSRGVQLALVGVIAIAFVGFFVGIQQDSWRTDPTPPHPYPAAVVQEGEPDSVAGKDVVPATAYADFDRRALGPNRGWQSTLAALPRLPQVFDPMDKEEADKEEVGDAERDEVPDFQTETRRAAALIARASRRAYEGAPPLVPHPSINGGRVAASPAMPTGAGLETTSSLRQCRTDFLRIARSATLNSKLPTWSVKTSRRISFAAIEVWVREAEPGRGHPRQFLIRS